MPRTRAGAASSAAAAIQTNPDATPDQITDAIGHSNAAQSSLALIVSANTAATLATTPEQANAALANARAAQGTLNASASAISSIQGAVQAAANQRQQREADEMALTGGSSLIRHVRANKLLADAVLGDAGANLTGDSLVVNGAGANPSIGTGISSPTGLRTDCDAPCAEYPANTEGANRVTGQRRVRIEPTVGGSAGGVTLVSDSTTPTLTGTGRLTHGFDLNNATTRFVNAYTDIAPERRGARITGDDAPDADNLDTPYNEQYNYIIDTDYLLAGIWLTVDTANLSNSRIVAFAYGGQPTRADTTDDINFCTGNENGGTSGAGTTSVTVRECGGTTGFNTIAGANGFVKDGQDVKATYNGNTNGVYLAGSDTSYFTADVKLDAEFQNPTGETVLGKGSIVGEVTNIVAGGQQMAGSIELQKQTFENDIGGNDKFNDGSTIGVVDGKSYGGTWKGQFFGMPKGARSQTKRVQEDTPNTGDTTTTYTTTYSPAAPGSVAGTFYATQQSAPAGSAAFIGAFTAHR